MEPDVVLNAVWKGDKLTASVVIDGEVTVKIEMYPVDKVDDVTHKYLDVAMKMLKDFQVAKNG